MCPVDTRRVRLLFCCFELWRAAFPKIQIYALQAGGGVLWKESGPTGVSPRFLLDGSQTLLAILVS